MPNNNNDEDLTNLSIEEINALFSDIIEFPYNIRVASGAKANITGAGCAEKPGGGK